MSYKVTVYYNGKDSNNEETFDTLKEVNDFTIRIRRGYTFQNGNDIKVVPWEGINEIKIEEE